VRANREGDDHLYDFLVNDEAEQFFLPDTLYLSDGSVAPVEVAENVLVDGPASSADREVHLTADMTDGWCYLRLDDPGAHMRLDRVVRSDGVEILVGDNAWQTKWVFDQTNNNRYQQLPRLHLLDYDGTGSYTLYYIADDSVAPELTAIEAVASPAPAPVASIEVTFSEEIDLSTFDYGDVVLTRNGEIVPLTDSVTVSHVSGYTYRIDNLAGLAGEDGNYQLTVNAAGIRDYGGNAGTNSLSTDWAMGLSAPVIVSLEQPASPRNSAVSSLEVVFSRSMNPLSLDVGDFLLTRNGEPVALDGVSVDQVSATTYRITGLGALTALEGEYTLTMQASGTQDEGGNPGVGQLTRTWRLDTTAPAFAGLQHLATNPRNIVVMSLDVDFTEAIAPASFDWQDITLTRNDGDNLITDVVTVEQVDADTYRIKNFNWVVGLDGTYILTVAGAGITDLAGNVCAGSVSETWVMDTGTSGGATNLAILPDNGASATDGLTNSLALTLTGDLPEAGLNVRLTDTTTGAELGYATVTGTTFSGSFTLGTPGGHTIRVRVVDQAGNVAPDSFFDVFLDLGAPGLVTVAAVTPNPRTTPVETLDVTLTEPVLPAGFTYADLNLTRDGSPVDLDATVTISHLSGNTYRIAGLSAFTGAVGAYQLTVLASGLMDSAGNAGVGQGVASWTVAETLPTGVQGVCYEDLDGDGIFDAGETPLADRTVFLDADYDGILDEGELWVASGADGAYIIDDLSPGLYRVAQVLPADWMLTAPAAGFYELEVAADQVVGGKDFANFLTGQICGVKFHDLDADGTRNADEPPLAGWTVFVDLNRDGVLDEGEPRMVTEAEGAFVFTGLGPSLVQVGEVSQDGWMRTTPETPYRVNSGFSKTADLGNVQLGSITGVKFEDLDGDGQRDPDEPGLAGWTIFLDADGDGYLDTDEVSTQTDAEGRYTFNNLLPGLYIVAEAQRTGWTQTSPLDTVPEGFDGVSISDSRILMESLASR
jgi:hypothetical protein